MGDHRSQEIQAKLTRRMDLWERGLHTGLVGDAKAEGASREGRAASGGEEEEEVVARSYDNTVLWGKLWQAVRRATDKERGGCLLLDDQCTKTGRLVVEVLHEKHLDMRVPPVENPTCIAFKKYGAVTETVPLDFTEDDVTWVASKLSGAAGVLVAESIELRNWLLRFRCVSEDECR